MKYEKVITPNFKYIVDYSKRVVKYSEVKHLIIRASPKHYYL